MHVAFYHSSYLYFVLRSKCKKYRWYQMLQWWISSLLWRPPQNRGERVFLRLLQ